MVPHSPAAVSYCEYAETLAERYAILESSSDAIVRLDREGKCVFLNTIAQRLLGRNCSEATRAIADSPELSLLIPACNQSVRIRGQCVLRRLESAPLPLLFLLQPVIVDDAAVGAILRIREVRDIHAQVEPVLAQLPVGTMLADSLHGAVATNERLAELFGVDPGLLSQLCSLDDWPMQHLGGGRVSRDEHPLRRALKFRERIIAEKYRIQASGSEERVVSVNASPISYLGYTGSAAVAVFTDVTERESLIRHVEEAHAHLKQSHADLQRFAAVAAHDLKEPVATIRKQAESLAAFETVGADNELERRLCSITANCDRLLALVHHMLTVAQFTSAPLRLELTCGETLLWMAVSQLQAQIQREHARITSDPLPDVFADQTQITRVLQNLISNAIKYRHPERVPEIHVSGKESDDEVQIEVRDNGCGIPEDERERIFEPYRRLHGNEVAGSGLGLWICRQIVERHGGRIWVESTHGKGSCFGFAVKR